MKIKQLNKSLTKVVQAEYGADGYVRLDEIVISLDETNYITLKGAYGRCADGTVKFQKTFTLIYADGMSADNIAGMLYQKIIDEADGN